ncbi:MAG: quinolinate synthase NadA [Methanomassiliicoccales archaeon]|nr:MAG: quinolinate synthase NadA [Methanomassiliicoccales archaeon]
MTEIIDEILRLKHEKNAVVLAHNYQVPQIQDLADFVGDSLALAVQATKVETDTIIFCGVDFMAESALILNPQKTVVHPNPKAKCPMAAMVDVEGLRLAKKETPKAVVVSYVNTTADVKTETDICCTSANAVKVIKSLEEDTVLFVPDSNLGLYAQRYVPEKKFIFWPGYCHVHQDISVEQIRELKREFPDAEVLVHPECSPDVIDIADFVFSTEGMVRHCSSSASKEFIIGTEEGLVHRLKKENPGSIFHAIPDAVCPNMKKITLEDTLNALRNLEPRVVLSKEVIEKARAPLDKMVAIGRQD